MRVTPQGFPPADNPQGRHAASDPVSSAVLPVAIAVVLSVACAPPVDGPLERQRTIDREDGGRLAAQLAQLPGVVAAEVALHHAVRDPLAVAPPPPAALGAVIAIDDRAAPEAIRVAAERLARAAVPELAGAPAIEIHTAVHRATLAKVGPFWVEASSRAPLQAVLALGCLSIAGLAGALALRARAHRLGSSAQ